MIDMCTLGLQVDRRGLNKKPTGVLTNHPLLCRLLDGRLCPGGHRHAALEGKAQTSQTVRHPPQFVRLAPRAEAE
eukprot:1413240-Pyramimonas_sp.AAC.1